MVKIRKKRSYRHRYEGRNLIDVGKHGDLGDNVRDKYCEDRFIVPFSAFSKEGEPRDEMIPSKCLQELG